MVLGIYGSGGAGKETKEIAEMLNKWSEIVFIDDTVEADTFMDIRRMPFEDFCKQYPTDGAELVISLGEPKFKKMLYDKISATGYSLANVIHKAAWVSPSAKLGKGIIMRSGAIVNACVTIEDNVTLMEYTCIGHDTTVGSNTQISGNVIVGGHSSIGNEVYIGLNVPIKDGITIGNGSIISIGSVVTRDIPEAVIALGNPARAMRKCDEDTKVFS